VGKPMVKKTYAKSIGVGLAGLVKVPWRLTNIVMLSLEKVSH